MENKLWYTQPAKNWNEALPLGNGSLGAMQFGGVLNESFFLNLDTLWSGRPLPQKHENKTAQFEQICKLAAADDMAAAQNLAEKALCGSFGESYLPLGEITFCFEANEPIEKVENYYRELDLFQGLSEIKYSVKNTNFLRQAFINAPDSCFAFRAAAENGTFSFTLRLSTLLQAETQLQNNILICCGECPVHVAPNYVQSDNPVVYDKNKHGIGFAFAVRVITNGQCNYYKDCIRVQNATEAVVLLCGETSFRGWNNDPYDANHAYVEKCLNSLARASKSGWRKLLENHKKDFTAEMEKCVLHLGEEAYPAAALPTNKRLLNFAENKSDIGLAALLFNYGRYLMLSSSRPGTQAANLQGIWNHHLRAPWCSNYTLNINTQMNYWHVFSANLSQCAAPALALLEDLSQAGKSTAKNYYGTKGFVTHHNTDIWRLTTPVGEQQMGCACYGFWPFGAAWLCRIAFEAYEYSQDTEILNRFYPLLKNAEAAFIPLLKKDKNNKLYFGPTTSPENNYISPKSPQDTLSVAKYSAMGQEILWDLLFCCQASAEKLGLVTEKRYFKSLMDMLVLPGISENGSLLEWDKELIEAEPNHRHVSHLYGLYPGVRINLKDDLKLSQACQKSLDMRGDAGTGWSLAWKVNLWARLGNGERAWKLLCNQLHAVNSETVGNFEGGGSYPNLLCAHPPFQIDGNFGATAGIIEMLLQSRLKDDCAEITFMPAKPSLWQKGSLINALAKGGISVSIKWESNKITYLTICSTIKQKVILKHINAVHCVNAQPNIPVEINTAMAFYSY